MDVVRRGPEDCWCEEGGLDGAQEEEEELFVPNGCVRSKPHRMW